MRASFVQGTSPTPAANAAPHSLGTVERDYCYAVAMKYVKDPEAAADVAQEALLLAHRHRARFRGEARFSTWLYRIAATSALMYQRKRRRLASEVSASSLAEGESSSLASRAAPAADPEQEVAAREAVELVRRRLAELGDKYRDIFWMRYFEGYTETEIAKELNLNLSTVKTRAHRARTAVRDTLSERNAA